MSYLLDTNIICEVVKPKPTPCVLDWLNTIPAENVFLSVLTLGEIRKGIEKINDLKRREFIRHWLENDLPLYFSDRILSIDIKVADQWGRLQSNLKGNVLPTIDGLLAATALTHQLRLVTRNQKDFTMCPLEVINPWESVLKD